VHALLMTVRIDPGREREAQEALETDVVPGVGRAPGIVGGYWLEAPEHRGLSVLLFEDEASARAAAERAPAAPMPAFVTFESAELRAVSAHL
jgi:hypothetical protein